MIGIGTEASKSRLADRKARAEMRPCLKQSIQELSLSLVEDTELSWDSGGLDRLIVNAALVAKPINVGG